MVTGSVAKELRIAEANRLAEVAREAEAKVLEAVEALNHARKEAQRPKQLMRNRHGAEVRISYKCTEEYLSFAHFCERRFDCQKSPCPLSHILSLSVSTPPTVPY